MAIDGWFRPIRPKRPESVPNTKLRPKTRRTKIKVDEKGQSVYGTTEDLILHELELIKKHQQNTNIDLYHIKLDLFKLMEVSLPWMIR